VGPPNPDKKGEIQMVHPLNGKKNQNDTKKERTLEKREAITPMGGSNSVATWREADDLNELAVSESSFH